MKRIASVVFVVAACGGAKAPSSQPKARAKLELRIEGMRLPFLTNADIERCTAVEAFVQCKLTADAAPKLANNTAQNVGKTLEIVVDGEVKSRPKVMEPVTGDQFTIALGTGAEAEAEAQRLAEALSP